MPSDARRHIVMYSGGIGSWAAAWRVVQQRGRDNVTLFFSDTKMEDEDLYRFLDQTVADLGVPLVRVSEGRNPWEVFFDERMMGNTRADPCSRVLKREIADGWLDRNCDPASTIVYVGIDWSEEHRFDDGQGGGLRPRRAEAGWRYEAPMCAAPYVTKKQMLAALASRGIAPPRLYVRDFPHNNCGGFCVKAGQATFALLLQHFPERYAWHEENEQRFREMTGKDVSIMRDRRGGQVNTMTMRAFRERVQSGDLVDKFDLGGCGCFVE